MELATSAHDDTAALTWLVEALEYARTNGQERVVGSLEAVLDDMVFEMEAAARKG